MTGTNDDDDETNSHHSYGQVNQLLKRYPRLVTPTTHTLVIIAVVIPIDSNAWRVLQVEVIICHISVIVMSTGAAWLGAVVIVGIDDAIIVIATTSWSTSISRRWHYLPTYTT